jgi:glycosyltransferase involved in cell wall biosynthesis
LRILWFNWKDLDHPLAGGAEVVNEELAKRLVKDGHEVTFVVAGFSGGKAQVKRDGFSIVRVGGRVSVYWKAYRYFKNNLKSWPDLVIDEINTVPFFAKFYTKKPTILFFHMLCRQIWFYQLPQPLSSIGYVLEPLYLRLLRGSKVITVSESTKQDLVRNGFNPTDISIISEGIELKPVPNVATSKKFPQPTLLTLGALRAMKRPDHAIRAFELAKPHLPSLKLIVAGESASAYGRKIVKMINASPYSSDIQYLGRVSPARKHELMQRSHLLVVTSVKEGWGLTVSEAASQGTPAAVYDVDGLRDSVRRDKTGIVCKNSDPGSLSEGIVSLLQDPRRYATLRKAAWLWSKDLTFNRSYQDFKKVIGL